MYKYDTAGNVISETEKTAKGNERTKHFEYDDMGRVISVTDAMGNMSGYTYDANGNILTVNETDKEGNSKEITRTYDSMNRVTSYTDYKGDTVKYGYDELGNIISIKCEEPNESFDTKVNDDSADNTSDIPDTSGNTVSNMGNNTSSGKSYNTSTITMTSSSMTYDECNQMTSYNGEEVIYDNDGNMIYGPLNCKMVEFEYDCRNRLIRAGDTLYEYDAENNRIAVETPEYREEYVIDSSQELTRILEIERTYKKDSDREAERDTLYYGNGLLNQSNHIFNNDYITFIEQLGSIQKNLKLIYFF